MWMALPQSVALFPAAAPLLNVRQASEPMHWLLGAVILLLAYLGWKPLGGLGKCGLYP